HQSEGDEERRLDVEQPADAIDSLVDDQHVDRPEEEEAKELRERDAEGSGGAGRERWNKDRHDLVNGVAADPGLDPKPAARDKGAHQGRNIGAASAEGGA